MGHNPASVAFTERTANITVMLEPLTAKKRTSDDFWLFLSGLVDGTMFAKNSEDWQLLNGTAAFSAVQRMGQEEDDDFVLVLEDNS